ncbi:glycosyltransferase family 4 protein [Paenibacillus sp. J2TS4]|uniref:glycosyltransferase family 4 protein n=1 Tax=Paenibacillus sp. J2TS4 TaxID=2807194 RepID=UPI001B06A760|nr:glycosyltransferase family 4 protein [Paenibacillus sp. J2TS4]GIP31289.1 hypothetical protein J2TS4_04990 [Paenibacillus sp. J2TS4]
MKKILVLNHFPTVYPPRSGGTLRYFHLYNQLSNYYDITLLSQSLSEVGERVEFSPTFREYKVQKDPLHKQISKEIQNKEMKYELPLIVNMKVSEQMTEYKRYYDDLYKTSDIIIHESPYLLKYDRYLGVDHKPRIYNSHNHEFLLAEQLWTNKKARKYLQSIYELEKKLVENADLIFATSEDERNSFLSMYNLDSSKIKLAPNGINPEEWIRRTMKSNGKTEALFIGANYPPNIEAVRYILQHLADQCPDIQFIIAGSCCKTFEIPTKSNVILLGKVSHKQKLKLFSQADIAINPMSLGAGVNIKTLEFLSAGIPLFSTPFGARGLNLIDMKHYIRVEKENFADKINTFCRDEKRLQKIASRGQEYINKNYSWFKLAKNIKKEIDRLINQI